MTQLYDSIGKGYRAVRRSDPYWLEQITNAIGDCNSLINVGAGAGSYERRTKTTVAVEPSFTMIKQRNSEAAPAVQAQAEALPVKEQSFAVAMSVLSAHHWNSRPDAYDEIARVATQRAVFVTWDPEHEGYWLTQQYFPEILRIDRDIFPPIDEFRSVFGSIDVVPLLVPHDCIDGFLGAYWRRPQAYLEPAVRNGMSTFSKLDSLDAGLTQLRNDLASGRWHMNNKGLMQEEFADLGYRIVTARIQ